MKLTYNEIQVIKMFLYRERYSFRDVVRLWPPEDAATVWQTISELYSKMHIPISKQMRKDLEEYVGYRYDVNRERIKKKQEHVNNKNNGRR